MVDYGDGTGLKPLALNPDKTFTLSHVYTRSGEFTVTVTITDNSQTSATETLNVTVINTAPTVSFNNFTITSPVIEGGLVELTGAFADAGDDDVHTVDIDWGDGTFTYDVPVNPGERTFSTTHHYLDDTNPNGTATASDLYRIQVFVRDQAGVSSSTPLGLFLQEVRNVRPFDFQVNLSSENLIEGDTLALSGSFRDPGVLDVHELRIDWGDGSPLQVFTLDVGVREFSDLPELSHVYANDPLEGPDEYTVRIELVDDDEPNTPNVIERTITVGDSLPSNIVLTPSSSSMIENDLFTLSGSFVDPGVLDSHRLVIDWGDGSALTTIDLATGDREFSGIEHRYANDRDDGSNYVITARVIDVNSDAEIPHGVGNTSIAVADRLAEVTQFSFLGGATLFDEGDVVTLVGSYFDPSPVDRHSVRVTWGDGTTTSAVVDRLARTFTASHRFVDNGTLENFDADTFVTVTDLRNGISVDSSKMRIRINNVAPQDVFFEPDIRNQIVEHVRLNSSFFDPGINDTHVLSWRVNGAPITNFDSGTPFDQPVAQPALVNGGKGILVNGGVFNIVELTVTDDDGGVGIYEAEIMLGSDSNDYIQLTNASFTAGVNNLQVVSLGGTDVLDATGITDPNLNVVLAGGDGVDYLFGGAGNDVYILSDDDDKANVSIGGIVPNDGGDDTYRLKPNSTLTVIDLTGSNTLDFGLADFGDNSGITYDLSAISTTILDSQVVSFADGTDHIVRVQGIFDHLIGSEYADVLTASSGATLEGGAGNDTFRVLDGMNDISFSGGADDDFLEVTGTNISNLFFNGDDGVDHLINTGNIDGLTFSGGADDDILQNFGTINGSLLFSGDDGVDILTNTGSIDELIFQGGADEDIFINNGEFTTSLNFSAGADDDILLTGLGTIGNLIFNGDDGADIFVNLGSISGLTFNGGADDDIFINNGVGVSSLNFGGDSDVLLAGEGTIGSLNFNGDDGNDIFANLSVIENLVFSGGADDDLFINNGEEITTLSFGGDNDILLSGIGTIGDLNFAGDSGSDMLINLAEVSELTYSGGADDDIFINSGPSLSSLNFGGDMEILLSGTGIVDNLLFNGDAGLDSLINHGSIASLTFAGGADDDVLLNEGTILGTLLFGGDSDIDTDGNLVPKLAGDSGADSLINNGTIENIVFSGGADDDILFNRGQILGNINFQGDEGLDILQNVGTILGSLSFSGDDGVDILANGGQIAELIFNGGADDDILINAGPDVARLNFGGDTEVLLTTPGSIANLVFNGDEGSDRLLNYGEITNLVFSGGADDDVLRNVGTILEDLVFNGDTGSDILQNEGIIASLTFGGGADDDILINRGTVTGSLNFGGDHEVNELGELVASANIGKNTLFNSGTLNNVNFLGGRDNDVFRTDGPITGLLNFVGDEGSDTLLINATVANVQFSGGADDDVLINSASITGSLVFAGDEGNDLLLNKGSDVANMVFSGGAGDDILRNEGSSIGNISFEGGDGSDALLNVGHDIGILSFAGGAGDDKLISEGHRIGQILFGGDLDADGQFITGTNLGDDTLIVRGSGDGSEGSRIVFYGEDGIDAFQNNATGFASIDFFGGLGDDVFQNNANSVTGISFYGNEGNDVFENNGANVRDMMFYGEEGNDIFVNDGRGLTNFVFFGGLGDDSFLNNGERGNGLVFHGNEGKDSLLIAGANNQNITFAGGADSDVMVVEGGRLSNLVFAADSDLLEDSSFIDADQGAADFMFLRSTATAAKDLLFIGGEGDDRLRNEAPEVSRLTFIGGTGDDGFQNDGVGLRDAVFLGGDGDDILINNGDRADQLLFFGGSGNDGFAHRGKAGGSIRFSGDAGDDTMNVSGAASLITFGGGGGNDVLSISNNAVLGDLFFGGDQIIDEDSLQLIDSGAIGNNTLVNNGIVNRLHFTGGDGDDVLQNNNDVLTLLTFLGGGGHDSLVNNAPQIGRMFFDGMDGNDTLINNSGEVDELLFEGRAGEDVLRIQGGSFNLLRFNGHEGADSFTYKGNSGPGSSIHFDGGPGNDILSWDGHADSMNFQGGPGEDLVFVVGSGNLTLDGGEGNDTIRFIGSPTANVIIQESFTGDDDPSEDLLDFSAFTAPLTLDLRKLTPQNITADFSLQFTDSMGMESVIGTPFADEIDGNGRDNKIYGAKFSEPFDGPVAARRSETQWVLLDFDSHTNEGILPDGSIDEGEHDYTPAERNAIVQSVMESYRGPDHDSPWFDVMVTESIDDIPAIYRDAGDYATLYFNLTPAFGRPGGLASEIDLGNQRLSGTSQIQINGLLGGVVIDGDNNYEGPTAEGNWRSDGYAGNDESLKDSHAAVSDAEVGAIKPEASSENFVILTSKIAAHELGHLLGLRHHDSFGPIGYGLHDPPGPASYKPIYSGPTGAYETFDHIISSPASVGSNRFNDLKGLFFGEREAVKLAYAFLDPADSTITDNGDNHTVAVAQDLPLVVADVPNTLKRGLNADKVFYVQMLGVNGEIDVDTTSGVSNSDWYQFEGLSGELVNIDVMSNSLARFGGQPNDYVDTVLRVWYVQEDTLQLVPYHGGLAENDDIFEPTDSSIVDLVLPADGTYYIEVDTFVRQPSDPNYDAIVALRDELERRRDDDDPTNDLSEIELDALHRINDSLNDTDIGQYHLFMFQYRDASIEDLDDALRGNGGDDLLDGGPGDLPDMEYELGGDFTDLVETNSIYRELTLIDPVGETWDGSTVDYGDGSEIQPLTIAPDGTFQLEHTYQDSGQFTVTVYVENNLGQSLERAVLATIDNVAPSGRMEVVPDPNADRTYVASIEDATDVSPGDREAGLRYSFALDPANLETVYADASTERSQSIVLAGSGMATIHGRVIDKDGGYNDYAVEVDLGGSPPTAVIEGPESALEGSLISLDGSKSSDPDQSAETLDYLWDLDGDGNFGETGADAERGDESLIKPELDLAGINGPASWSVWLQVIDEDGFLDAAMLSLSVENAPPSILSVEVPSSVAKGQFFTLIGGYADPGLDDVHSMEIAWGDGNTVQATIDPVARTFTAEHAYAIDPPGTDSSFVARLTLRDTEGGKVTRDVEIAVSNGPRISRVAVNGGAAQRSSVTTFEIEFDSEVEIDDGAFLFEQRGVTGGTVPHAFDAELTLEGHTLVRFTFAADSGFTRGNQNALVDGNYQFIIDPEKVRLAGTTASLSENGTGLFAGGDGGEFVFGDTEADEFFAFFGDGDGDRDVDEFDFLGFRRTYRLNSSNSRFNAAFDSEGDGDVDVRDFLQFRRQYRRSLGY